MNQAEHIYDEAERRGLHLKSLGDKLAVTPRAHCAPEFAELLRQHKRELLDLLKARSAGLTPDCAPWLHIARQVLAGEFDGADRSLAESLYIGLRAIKHSDCQRASARLRRLIPEEKTEGESKPEQTKI